MYINYYFQRQLQKFVLIYFMRIFKLFRRSERHAVSAPPPRYPVARTRRNMDLVIIKNYKALFNIIF